MVFTTEGFNNNSPRYPMTLTPVKKPSARKSLCLFTNILYVKKKADINQVRAAKSKLKAIKSRTKPWLLKPKRKLNSKINNQIKKSLINWIMHHPQDVQLPIFDDSIKVNIDSHTEPQIVSNIYCRSLSENFVTALLVTQYKVDSKRQKIHKTISLSVIINYVHCCHPIYKSSINIQGYLLLWILYIRQKYTFIITIMVLSVFKINQG